MYPLTLGANIGTTTTGKCKFYWWMQRGIQEGCSVPSQLPSVQKEFYSLSADQTLSCPGSTTVWRPWVSMIDVLHQCQRLRHILSLGVATHFWSNSLGLLRNISNLIRVISSDIVALTLTLSADGPSYYQNGKTEPRNLLNWDMLLSKKLSKMLLSKSFPDNTKMQLPWSKCKRIVDFRYFGGSDSRRTFQRGFPDSLGAFLLQHLWNHRLVPDSLHEKRRFKAFICHILTLHKVQCKRMSV